jgi:hypothetical protein
MDTMNTTQIQNVKEWIKELRSGNWNQTTNNLCNKEGYCCLGIACEIKGVLRPSPKAQDIKGMIRSDGTFGSGLPEHEWFKDNYGIDLFQKFDFIDYYKDKNQMALSELNDFAGFTFNQIADVLEEHINKQELVT